MNAKGARIMPEVNPRAVRYHLRATVLPARARTEGEALYRVVREAGIDEVMFFLPHAEEMSPGLGTERECLEARDAVRPLFDRLREMGVVPSVNIWWTKSFSNFGLAARDLRGKFDFRWAVSARGVSDYTGACPLDERWLEQACRMYAVFAELRPGAMWLDDDVQARFRGEIRGACFCSVCLDEMARRTGRARDRDELLRAVLADPPNPVREIWLRFQEAIMLRIVSRLREAVHAVSPETRMGVMHSNLETHFAEGRRWAAHMKAACGPHPVLARPHIGPYSQGAVGDNLAGMNNVRQVPFLAGGGDCLAPELENYPHTSFNKSWRLAAAEMTVSQLMGMREITLSVLRFGGGLDLDPVTGKVTRFLARLKPRLQAISDLALTPGRQRGLGLFWHENVAAVARTREVGDPFTVLQRRRPWDHTLGLMGFATTYGPSDVAILSGEAIACLDGVGRRALLSRGVLLDARAAATLIALGDGELIGLGAVLDPVDACQEVIEDPAFGGQAGEVLNTRAEGGRAAQFALLPGARAVSQMLGYGAVRTGHGLTVFTNALGGRAAVWPFDAQILGGLKHVEGSAGMARPVFQASFGRQRQLYDVFTWLAGAPPDLFVPDAPNVLPLLSRLPDRSVVGVVNGNSDPIENVVLELRDPAHSVRRVQALGGDGCWRACAAQIERASSGAWRIATGLPLEHLETAVFLVD